MITSCILCDHRPLALAAERQSIIVHRCDHCGLLQAEDRNSSVSADDEAGAVATAPAHFHMLVQRDEDWRRAMRPMLDARLSWIGERVRGSLTNWLEIGPGNGGLGQLLVESGAYWLGVEFDRAMATRMQEAGKNVLAGDFAQMDPADIVPDHLRPSGGFDIVFLSQVFEHVTAPARFLENALACLRPGGAIYIDVPNNGGLTALVRALNGRGAGFREIVPPHHMIAYGADTLSYALDTAGFGKIETFATAYDHPVFGLVHARLERSPKLKAVWKMSGLTGLGGNLVAFAVKPATA